MSHSVPVSFIEVAPADGTMMKGFVGEGEGELDLAEAGDCVWQIDAEPEEAHPWKR